MQIIESIINLIYPRICLGCGGPLVKGEKEVCLSCYSRLDRTNYHNIKDNNAEMLLWGKARTKRGTAFCHFTKGGTAQRLLHQLKYMGEKDLGIELGRTIGATINGSAVAEADLIVPVPLHKSKLRKRGYNQAEMLAEGISEVIGIPVENKTLYRVRANQSQTRKGVYDRWQNSQELFDVHHTGNLDGKRILLVDDVLTTGATIEACCKALEKTKASEINFVCFAIA